MKFTIHRRTWTQGALALAMAWAMPAIANDFPQKTLKIIVPFAAGGPVDSVARDLAVKLGENLGQSVVVDNIGGGAGLPAMQALARASADGHTMILAGASHVTIQTLLTKAGADAASKLEPVSLVSTSPHVLFVSSKLPVKTFQEFIDYAKARPGQLNYASAGAGSVSHLGMEVINAQAGIKATHVAYRGTSQATVDLAAGQVQFMLSSMASLKGLVAKDVVRPLALTSATQATDSKHLLLVGSVLPDAAYTTWYAMYVPLGTPATAVTRLNKGLAQVLAEPEFKTKFRELGTDLQSSSAKELLALTQSEIQLWKKAITQSGITVD
jgi:tripartite-type tricarboxylate transporter receptor subunit TctC